MSIDKLLLLFVLGFIFYMYKYQFSEEFANKQAKADVIYKWFNENRDPTFTKYKKDLGNDANIVEYEAALALAQSKKLTVGNVVSSLNWTNPPS